MTGLRGFLRPIRMATAFDAAGCIPVIEFADSDSVPRSGKT